MAEPKGNEAGGRGGQLQAMGEDAKRLLRSAKDGVLATLSQKHSGYPFTSLVPYAISKRGEPIFLFSGLSQHTKNVRADPRACLFAQEAAAGDPQAAGRVAILGKVVPVAEAEKAEAKARYLSAHPQTEMYFSLGDFELFVLAMEDVHLVGGFARAAWVSASALRDPA